MIKKSTNSKHVQSLTAHNDDIKNKLQKRELEISTLNIELLKTARTDVNTKFDKPSMPIRKPRTVRQISAFSTNRSKMSKSRCAPLIGTDQELSKTVTSQCQPKVVKTLNKLIRKDSEVHEGIPNRARTPSLKNTHSTGINTPSIRQSTIGPERSDIRVKNNCLKWVPTGRIFKLMGLRWIPMQSSPYDKRNSLGSTIRETIHTNSCQDKQNPHIGAGFSISGARFPSERLKVWRRKDSLPTTIGNLVYI